MAVLIYSLLLAIMVFWYLKLIGITKEGEAFCGKDEHIHDANMRNGYTRYGEWYGNPYGNWDSGKVARFPCRYMGSMYDGTLILGGSDNDGQFDFIKRISNGERVLITDATGMRYRYAVTAIRRTKDVSTDGIRALEADLIFFAKNSYSMDYTVVYCDLA